MQVILIKDVRRLGSAGDVKRVADGYARNYLIPRQLAEPATDAARRRAADRQVVEARLEATAETIAREQATQLEGVQLVFQAKAGEGGRLYGSITSGDIAEELSKAIEESVDRRKVRLEEPIKELGKSTVEVRLHTDVRIDVTVLVESQGEV